MNATIRRPPRLDPAQLNADTVWGLAPATIRNTMADLEELGYVTQPHPSAGRVPTEIGYRVYVDTLMEAEELSNKEKLLIQEEMRLT